MSRRPPPSTPGKNPPTSCSACAVRSLCSRRLAWSGSWEGDSGEVVHLSADNFDDMRTEHPKIFAMFYAPW